MLQQLMVEIREGGTLETSVLAKKLHTTPAMIGVMLDHLRQVGFLKSYESNSNACAGCSLSNMCDKCESSNHVQLWQYEEKK